MARRYSRIWTGLTMMLSVVFAVLFFPAVHARYTLTESLAYTILGLIVIWGVYFTRAAILSHVFSREKSARGHRDIVR